jgi:hypothetical protein
MWLPLAAKPGKANAKRPVTGEILIRIDPGSTSLPALEGEAADKARTPKKKPFLSLSRSSKVEPPPAHDDAHAADDHHTASTSSAASSTATTPRSETASQDGALSTESRLALLSAALAASDDSAPPPPTDLVESAAEASHFTHAPSAPNPTTPVPTSTTATTSSPSSSSADLQDSARAATALLAASIGLSSSSSSSPSSGNAGDSPVVGDDQTPSLSESLDDSTTGSTRSLSQAQHPELCNDLELPEDGTPKRALSISDHLRESSDPSHSTGFSIIVTAMAGRNLASKDSNGALLCIYRTTCISYDIDSLPLCLSASLSLSLSRLQRPILGHLC